MVLLFSWIRLVVLLLGLVNMVCMMLCEIGWVLLLVEVCCYLVF